MERDILQPDKVVMLDAILARIRALRIVLGWLIARTDPEGARHFLQEMVKNELPLQDQQEDPGAVPTEAFAALAAFGDEVEEILAVVSDLHAPPTGP